MFSHAPFADVRERGGFAPRRYPGYAMQVSILKRPLMNGPFCGDACGHWEHDGRYVLTVIDGLGHGEEAEKAATAALAYLGAHLSDALPAIFAGCNATIATTRGVAMGIAIIDPAAGSLTFAGVGNTRTRLIGRSGGRKSYFLSSTYGIVGGGFRKIIPETVEIAPGEVLLMYTDGVKEVFDVSGYNGLFADGTGLARRILDDWGRETDDAAVMVWQYEG